MSRNPVTPGSPGQNLLSLPGLAGTITGNFNRTGEAEATADEYRRRLLRPGAILLANLDIDHPLDGRPRHEQLDGKDHRVSPGDDSREMATLQIEPPAPRNARAAKVVLEIHPEDARRVRLFRSTTTTPVVMGEGKTAQAHETFTRSNEHQLELDPAARPWRFHFEVEAVTLAGSPLAPGPCPPDDPSSAPDTPNEPTPYEVLLPADPATPVQLAPPANNAIYRTASDVRFRKRLPGEVWFELRHLDHAGNPLPAAHEVRDVALYTIAPWLMLSNLRPAEVLYIADLGFNPDTMGDIRRAMRSISGVTLHTISDSQCHGDQWVQDEFEIGYCWAVHNWMHVTLHCKRSEPDRFLSDFVRNHLPGSDMGLFEDIAGAANSINFGGNLEVSPPVDATTHAMAGPDGGPDVPVQEPAPFGKILLGHTPDRGRPAHAQFLQFLEAQIVQPVLPLDTSWLSVGHVDEFMIFVPANTSKGFKLLMASPPLATAFFEEALALHRSDPAAHPLTKLLRGKQWLHEHSRDLEPPAIFQADQSFADSPEPTREYLAEISVESVLAEARDFNDELFTKRLQFLEDRLARGCDFDPVLDVIPLPVYFDALPLGSVDSGGRTAAFTPGLVNLQVLNRHVLVPRPFGPRMNLTDAGSLLRGQFGLAGATDARLRSYLQHEFWVVHALGPSVTAARIAGFFADGGVTEAGIRRANPGKFDGAGRVRPVTRLLIPEDTVDLFEAYTQMVLEDIGLTVHWIDDWYTYHRMEGEVHCGTNVKRRPPELDADSNFRQWWDVYAEMVR